MEIQEGYKELETLHELVNELRKEKERLAQEVNDTFDKITAFEEKLCEAEKSIEKLDDNLTKTNKMYYFFNKGE